MLAEIHSQHTVEDPFVSYARSLQEYTLQLWTDSIRATQEKRVQQKGVSTALKRLSGQKQSRQRFDEKEGTDEEDQEH